jgi:hypothetical protein
LSGGKVMAMTNAEIAKIRRLLKYGPRMTRRERGEYLRALFARAGRKVGRGQS